MILMAWTTLPPNCYPTNYKEAEVPVVPTPERIPWNQGKRDTALARGCHKSALEHIDFLRTKFTDMIKHKQWVLLPADLVMNQPNLQLSPLGVVPQRDRRPRTISNYSYFHINDDTTKSPSLPPKPQCNLERPLHASYREFRQPILGIVWSICPR